MAKAVGARRCCRRAGRRWRFQSNVESRRERIYFRKTGSKNRGRFKWTCAQHTPAGKPLAPRILRRVRRASWPAARLRRTAGSESAPGAEGRRRAEQAAQPPPQSLHSRLNSFQLSGRSVNQARDPANSHRWALPNCARPNSKCRWARAISFSPRLAETRTIPDDESTERRFMPWRTATPLILLLLCAAQACAESRQSSFFGPDFRRWIVPAALPALALVTAALLAALAWVGVRQKRWKREIESTRAALNATADGLMVVD